MKPAFEAIRTGAAPEPPGPFSQGMAFGDWVFVSGMGGLDPATGRVVGPGVAEQAEQAMRNVAAILAGAGCTLGDVVKATVYLCDMADYALVNSIYERHMGGHRPARTCVAVAGLPVEERMKLDVIAVRPHAHA
jgi:2-iminobutanoate/2-iminopropanoate deaminase